jgi:tetratricopeptide (TPR) repeat protein
MAQYFWVMGDNERALAFGQRALALATDHGDVGLKVMANLYLGLILYAQGHYRQAIDLLRKTVAALQGKLLRERLGQTGIPAVISRAWLSRCLAELGAFPEGIAIGEEGVRIAEAADQPFSLAHAYLGMGFLYLRKGDLPKAIPMLERSLELCQAWNISAVFPRTASALGATYALSERLDEALPLLEQAVEQGTSMRFMADYALQVAWLSEGYLLTGRMEDASALAGRALDLSRAHKERGHEAWALRLLGEIAAHQAPPEIEPAKHHYRQALTLAEELGMRPLMAHCHLGLGTLSAKTGQSEPARTALSAAIELYRAMDMIFWLSQAEAALAQVEGE